MTKKRGKNRKINNILILILLLMIPLTAGAFVWNLWQIDHVDSGKGETLDSTETDPAVNEYQTDLYTIGHNSTAVNKEYFKELAAAMKEGDTKKASEALVRTFVSEYYTWTNKDGNYDIGGMQYIFSGSRKNFETYTLWNFYSDMDLYIRQYGRDRLIEVESVTVGEPVQKEPYQITLEDGTEASYPECWEIPASWTYRNGSAMDTSSIQHEAVFTVITNVNRVEITGIRTPGEADAEEEPAEGGENE